MEYEDYIYTLPYYGIVPYDIVSHGGCVPDSVQFGNLNSYNHSRKLEGLLGHPRQCSNKVFIFILFKSTIFSGPYYYFIIVRVLILLVQGGGEGEIYLRLQPPSITVLF